MSIFKLHTNWKPCGDQPRAIDEITQSLQDNNRYQTLLGVTGSGKTFVMASVIRNLGVPALIMSHNKTLAAQLYSEFKNFFPENAVEYFVSYYDYYQPEAYLPQRDIYIEKDAAVNQELDCLRLAATSALVSRKDTIIVASVSAIYGLGDPEDYNEMKLSIAKDMEIDREKLIRSFVDMQYSRNDMEFSPGHFRVRGDVIELFPTYESGTAIRIELFGDVIENIVRIDPITKDVQKKISSLNIYPAKHFVMPAEKVEKALGSIEAELKERLEDLTKEGKLLEASRLESRTLYDMEMLKEVGFCSGIENYSRHFTRQAPGTRPYCLLDYFPKPYITIVDESHVGIPQIRGMFRGDRSRKETLVEYGFRLPSALDNRPLTFPEWEEITDQVLFVSATPGSYELESGGKIIEQLIRPTGLLDPIIEVRPTENQVKDLIEEIKIRMVDKERVLVTTLTKSLSEDLTEFLQEADIKVAYLHCDIGAFERVSILQDLRRGEYDAVVGINLLREGLDLPEVSLVAILDADRQGFLRSETSLIQTMGRAARHVNAKVVLYGDRITPAMKNAMDETQRRRAIQMEYNQKHNITPQSIQKQILHSIEDERKQIEVELVDHAAESTTLYNIEQRIVEIQKHMTEAAAALNFERAAELRDQLLKLQEQNNKQSKSNSKSNTSKARTSKKGRRPRKRSKI